MIKKKNDLDPFAMPYHPNRFVYMFTRGFVFFLCVICSFYNSECPMMETVEHFLQTGVYTTYSIIMFGLFTEAAMFSISNKYVLVSFLMTGVILSAASGSLALIDFLRSVDHKTHMMVKFVLITFATCLFIIETILLYGDGFEE